MVSFAALRDRFLADRALGDGASPGIARALEQIGWRAVGDPTPAELASHLVALVEACVIEHHDVDALAYAIAATLRQYGPSLDGGVPPVEAYLPAAETIVREYVAPAPRSLLGWSAVWEPS
jgi:hypothetical protein